MLKDLLAEIFSIVVSYRNNRYDRGKARIVRAKVPVISIGNLSVGGSGKTPVTIYVARQLLSLGKKPMVIGRGYGRRTKGDVIVSDGRQIKVDSESGGDEMLLVAESVNVPVVAAASKSKAAYSATDLFPIDCIVVDDGFQHRRLWRDLDIVIVDDMTISQPRLLPKGRLREPFESLRRADIIFLRDAASLPEPVLGNLKQDTVIVPFETYLEKPYKMMVDDTKAPANRMLKKQSNPPYPPLLKGEKQSNPPYPPLLKGEYHISPFEKGGLRGISLVFQQAAEVDIQKIAMVAVSGIAAPERFRKMLTGQGYNVTNSLDFPDHHRYTKKSIEKIVGICNKSGILNIAITGKDAVKLEPMLNILAKNNIICYVFPLELRITENESQFLNKLKSLKNCHSERSEESITLSI